MYAMYERTAKRRNLAAQANFIPVIRVFVCVCVCLRLCLCVYPKHFLTIFELMKNVDNITACVCMFVCVVLCVCPCCVRAHVYVV